MVLLAILAAAAWYAAGAWISIQGPPMPTEGYVAMALGVVFRRHWLRTDGAPVLFEPARLRRTVPVRRSRRRTLISGQMTRSRRMTTPGATQSAAEDFR